MGHGPRLALAFTSDGRSIVADDTRRAVVWDAKTGRRLRTFAPALSFAVSPAGNALVIGREDGSVAVASLDTGKMRELSGASWRRRERSRLHPRRELGADSRNGRGVLVWDVASGSIRETLSGHVANVQAPAVTPDGRTAVTVAHDATIFAWDLTRRRRLSRSSSVVPGTYSDLSADGKTLAVSTERRHSARSTARASGFAARFRWRARRGGSASAPTARALRSRSSRPRRRYQGAFTGGTVALYDVKTRRPLRSEPRTVRVGARVRSGRKDNRRRPGGRARDFPRCALARDHAASRSCSRSGLREGGATPTRDLDWSPDGRRLAITYWNATEGSRSVTRPRYAAREPAAETSRLPGGICIPDGSLLVTGGNTGIPSFWDTRTWKLVARPAQGHGSAIVGMSVDPGGGPGDGRKRRRGRLPTGTSPRVARSARRSPGTAPIRMSSTPRTDAVCSRSRRTAPSRSGTSIRSRGSAARAASRGGTCQATSGATS